jgi:hypothetical protein
MANISAQMATNRMTAFAACEYSHSLWSVGAEDLMYNESAFSLQMCTVTFILRHHTFFPAWRTPSEVGKEICPLWVIRAGPDTGACPVLPQ